MQSQRNGGEALKRQDLLLCVLAFALTAASRLPFRSHILYSWDSVNYAFGMRHFNVLTEQPQPPGYIVYAWLARLVDTLTHDANAAMVWISVAAGALATVALYLLGRRLFGRTAGLAAAVLLATSPLFWFYGEIALPHTLDAALILTYLWLLWRVRSGELGMIWPATVVLAIAGGIRPQTLVFLLPVTVFAVWRAGWRRLLGAALLGALLCLAWFLPLVDSAGGLRPYLSKLSSYSQRFEVSTSVLRGAGLAGLQHNLTKLLTYTLFATAAALLPLLLYAALRVWRHGQPAPDTDPAPSSARPRRALFIALWAGPVLTYYALILMGQQGMILIFLPIVFLLAGAAAIRVTAGRRLWLLLACLGLLNASVFLFLPTQPLGLHAQHLPVRQTIRQNDRYYSLRFAGIAARLPAPSSAIIADNWRHVEYYLPGYKLLRLGAEADPAGAGRPSGWPGNGVLTASDLGLDTVSGRPVLVLFDGDDSALFDDLDGVETVSWPGAGGIKLYRWPPRTVLLYSGDRLEASTHPPLILDQTKIDRIKARISAGQEPEASSFRDFIHARIAPAMKASPTVYVGPYHGSGDRNHVFDTLNNDGARARNLGLAYAFTGDERYAAKSRQFLVAWAVGNTPTTQQDADLNDIGNHQSYGAFSFAYAYDLTFNSAVYGHADRAAIKAYFIRFVDAIKTSNDKIAADWYVSHPEVTMPYKWNATKSYHRADTYIGGDAALCGQTARLAMAGVIGYQSAIDGILGDTAYPLNLARMLTSALTPVNDGDGVAGHPVPTPQVYVYLQNTPGRGGMLDYMTYNARSCTILVDMARNLGWSAAQVTAARTKLHATWSYLARFFGPDAEPNFNPLDVVNLSANLPRFTLAYNDFGDQRFLDVMNSGNRVDYYEPQFLGPITLTHSLR